jgi:ElaB/YqjD/DUF883 family membrane-anchored ribosome-binding protein
MYMNSNPSSEHTTHFSSALGAEAEAAAKSSASPGHDGLSDVRRDMAKLTDTLARFASEAGGDAAKTVRSLSQILASQVSSAAGNVADAGSDLASSAKEHVKTFASELESMARRNPLGTIAGALLVGVIIGMMSKGRG